MCNKAKETTEALKNQPPKRQVDELLGCPFCGIIPREMAGYASIKHEQKCFIKYLLGLAKGEMTDAWSTSSNYHYRWQKRVI